MPRYLIEVEIPLAVDYTTTKKIAKCKVYFVDNSANRIECTINGKNFTPQSVNDDYNIISKAKELFRSGKFVEVTASQSGDKSDVKEYTDTYDKQIKNIGVHPATLTPVENKTLNQKKTKRVVGEYGGTSRSPNFNRIKNFIIKNSGKITQRDIVEKLGVSDSSVTTVLSKLKITKVRDMEYKWRGRRYFIVIDQSEGPCCII